VDRMVEVYKRVRDGSFGVARQLSAADKSRLNDHMENLYELERRLDVHAPTGVGCAVAENPGDVGMWDYGGPDKASEFQQTVNDIIVLAFACGTSKIASVSTLPLTPHDGSTFHTEIAHGHLLQNNQAILLDGLRRLTADVYIDLACK